MSPAADELWLHTPSRARNETSVCPAPTEPPSIAITDPASGSVTGTFSILAATSDNLGIKHVNFYINGALITTGCST